MHSHLKQASINVRNSIPLWEKVLAFLRQHVGEDLMHQAGWNLFVVCFLQISSLEELRFPLYQLVHLLQQKRFEYHLPPQPSLQLNKIKISVLSIRI